MAFTGTVRNAKEWSSTKPNHGYWELRYVRRTAAGSWEDAQNVLAANRQWSDSDRDWDILTDWPHIAVESGGTIHIAWHGTAGTHISAGMKRFTSGGRQPARIHGVPGANLDRCIR